MKLTGLEKPLVKSPNKGGRPRDPDGIANRCRELGVKDPPETIRGRMNRHNLTFEEALAWTPDSRSEISRKCKKNSPWSKLAPGSKLDHQLREEDRRRSQQQEKPS